MSASSRRFMPGFPFHASGSSCHSRAFSLLETLLVLATAAGLMLMALPTLSAWSQRLRIEWSVQLLMTAVAYTRAEAVRRAAPITLCRRDVDNRCSATPTRCHGKSVPGRDWQCGWAVVTGHRRLASRQAGSSRLLRRFGSRAGVSIVAVGNVNALTFRPPAGISVGTAGHFRIAPAGALSSAPGGTGRSTTAGEATSAGVPSRCLYVGMSGRIRVGQGAC